MENHPIPQDVTGFKFKLIGSITVKQFLYLLGFGILTTVSFVLPVGILIRGPLMILFAGLGVMLAFVPIEGRPMDAMIMNFAKTIPSENRYIYKKRGANIGAIEALKIVPPKPAPQPVAQPQQKQTTQGATTDKKSILLNRLRNSSFKPDETELKLLGNIKSFFDEDGVKNFTPVPEEKPETKPQPLPPLKPVAADAEPKQVASDASIELLKKQLDEAKKEQADGTASPSEMEAKIKELQAQLDAALNEKDALAKKMVSYEAAQMQKPEEVFKPSQGEEKEETESVKFVSPSSSLEAGFPSLPDVGNVVMGKVCDPRGKTLPNILVEVVDTNNIPVRAFKTNALGQFASATPLPDGTYKIYFEDPSKQHEFQIVEVTLDGSIFNPIVATSVDSREKLRRELFGNSQSQTA